MYYKSQLYAWITAMLLCAALAVALGSCGSSGSDGGGTGGGDGPVTTIAQAADKLIGCGYTDAAALTRQLERDFSLTGEEADGIVFPKAVRGYYEKLASAYLTCVVGTPCEELIYFYCGDAAESTLEACIAAADAKYASQTPGASFACSDKTALDDPADAVCDGAMHCDDASDETSKACGTVEHITCDKKSVPYAWRCNSDDECTDGADEAGCFVCSEGEVTLNTNRCDGREDCGNGSDEVDCPASFGCPPGTETEEITDEPVQEAVTLRPSVRIRAALRHALRTP
ncbi:MAG: LDL receptor domain-containing protein [Polyangiales bacterium]